MHDGHCVRTIHAERNAIAHAAKRGVATDRTTAYITTMPCPTCITDLVAAGIKSVVFLEGYHDEEDQVTRRLAAASGVVLYEYDGRKTWESPIDR
jgi:deoxycytidylate deaminase